jgi:lipopolysaccharide export system protein LptA
MLSKRTLLPAIIGILLYAGFAPAASFAASAKEPPLEITSRSMEADGGLKKVVFLGNVVAVQGDLSIGAAKLIVHYKEQGKGISRIEAIGDVRVEKAGRVATADRGGYEVGKAMVVLTGSARVQQGDNSVEGDEISFFLDSDRSIVKSQAGSRVRAILTPGENR